MNVRLIVTKLASSLANYLDWRSKKHLLTRTIAFRAIQWTIHDQNVKLKVDQYKSQKYH